VQLGFLALAMGVNCEFLHSISERHCKHLKIVHINAQSIFNDSKQAEFVDLFSSSGIDIIVVSETWLRDGFCVNMPNYNSYYVNRPSDRNGGGVAIFTKSSHQAKVISTSLGERNRPEYILLEVLVGSNKILVAGLYRPPKVGFLDAFQEDIYNVSVNYKYVFVCGDLNARFNSGSEETKIICDVLGLCNLHCVPFGPTFHIPGCDSNLDIISSNCPDLLIAFGQKMASGFSAHDLLYAVYNLLVPPVRKQRITCRNFNNIATDDLFNDLENASWEEIFNCNNINSKLEIFNGIITDVMDKHAPLKTFTAKQTSQPWMTKFIRKLIKKRNKLRIKYLRTNSAPDYEKFKDMRNYVKQEIRSAKAKFFYSKFDMCMSSKSTWATIRSLNIANKSAPANLIVPVNDLNQHYASVSSIKHPDLTAKCIKEYCTAMPHRDINCKFHFKYALPENIVKAINSIKSNAKGVDQIPVTFIKLCLPVILPVLEHIFNYSLQNSVFPTTWKKANILPLLKVKNPTEPKDYRPVSNLCPLSKALEKIVHQQVCDYLDKNNLFAEFQSGFRKNHSTVTALVKVTDDIRSAMDKKMMTLLVLLDLSKAFDCVHHKLLLTKLQYLGFSDAVVNWFSSYLCDRLQRVYMSNDLFSDWAEISTGVPQGSVLGPLLFLMYLFDLPTVISKQSNYHMYADDLQLYSHFSVNEFDMQLNTITTDVVQVIDFCVKHNLTLNVAKTQVIILGSQRYLTKLKNMSISQLSINNCSIPYSTNVTNLGVVFDATLSWNDHCAAVVKKIFAILAQLRRSFSFMPPRVRKMVVSSLVFPHIDYASVVFTDLSATNNLKLQKAQNAAMRFITGTSRYDHITPVYNQLNILKVDQRRSLAVSKLVWKIITTKNPSYLYKSYTFTSISNSRCTRSCKNMLQIPNHRLVKYNHSFHVCSSQLWNQLKLYNFLNKSYAIVSNYIFNCLLKSL